jgi:DNA relaxase NicK
VNWEGDQKLTIGSRVSDRYVRVYVKGERVRHEIELKHAPAVDAWAALLGGVGVREVWADHYGRVVLWR